MKLFLILNHCISVITKKNQKTKKKPKQNKTKNKPGLAKATATVHIHVHGINQNRTDNRVDCRSHV